MAYNHKNNRDNSNRRVSFKPNNRQNMQNNRQFGRKNFSKALSRDLFDEADIDMGNLQLGVFERGDGSSGRGRKSPPPYKAFKHRFLPQPSSKFVTYYKITIPNGRKHSRVFLLGTLQNLIKPAVLVPMNYRSNNNDVIFFVDKYPTALKLLNSDMRHTFTDGHKLRINVNATSPPIVDINESLKEKIKTVMAKKFNPATKALDLTAFHLNEELLDNFCGLFRPNALICVMNLITDNIPDIAALNLSSNYLRGMDPVRDQLKKLTNLKILHLSDNKIRSINGLEFLKSLPLVEINLVGNPFTNHFKSDQDGYVSPSGLNRLSFHSQIRKILPKVIKLDDLELPPPISFDLNTEVNLPTAKQSFMISPQGQEIVRQFLEQYFKIYDSDDRQPLMDAYIEQAMMAMTCSYPYNQTPKNSPALYAYHSNSRNLLRVQDKERRTRLLKIGRIPIISYLSEMPKTLHDLNSFTVDLHLLEPTVMMLTVTGVFKELGSSMRTAPIRAFNRTLVIVPVGSGFCIANELYHVTNATDEQRRLAFEMPPPTPRTYGGAPVLQPPTLIAPELQNQANSLNNSHSEPNPVEKRQMVEALALETRMNLPYSHKCLEDIKWDFQQALTVAKQLIASNVLPAEAFDPSLSATYQ